MRLIRGGPALLLALIRNFIAALLTRCGLAVAATTVALAALTGLAGCDDNPPNSACLVDGDPWCSSYKPGTGNAGNSGTGNNGGSGNTDCHDLPDYGQPCDLPNGEEGIWDCNAAETGLICRDINGSGGTGGGTAGNGGSGNAGNGGSGNSGNAGTGGTGNYVCEDDPQNGTICVQGVGICQRTGVRFCDGNVLKCSVSAGQPNSAGEICVNGTDDDCDGATDEQPCTDEGSGGAGGGGGTGGSGGGPIDCIPAPSSAVTILSSGGLTTLLKGSSSTSSSNPYQSNLVNGSLLSVVSSTTLSISVTSGAVNLWRPHTQVAETLPKIDELYCRQLGIDSGDPNSCNPTVFGDRRSASYLSALRIDWECWRKGGVWCPATIADAVPADLFIQLDIVEVGYPHSQTFTGSEWDIVEVPPYCP